MPRYPLGQPVALSTTVRDLAGALADAGGISLLLYGPDGALAQTYLSPTRDSLGLYHQDIPTGDLDTAGRWSYAWVATGANAGTSPTEVFDVDGLDSPPVVGLADVKDTLNLTATTYDAELRRVIAAATRVVEWKVGPVGARTVVDVVTGGGWSVWLPHPPVIALISTAATVTGGFTDAVADLDFDPTSGRVWRTDGGPVRPRQRWTYTAGRTVVPQNITDGAALIVQHLWETQRGAGTPARILGSEDVTLVPGLGFSVPNRALELLAPDALAPFLA